MSEVKFYDNKDGLRFILNDDLTSDEAIEADKLLNKLTVIDGNSLRLEQTKNEQNRLLEIILIPQQQLPDNFSYGSFRGSVSAQITADFFLAVLKRAANMMSSTKRSIMQQLKLSKDMKVSGR